MSRQSGFALAAIAFGGFLLRIAPLLRAGGPLAWGVDYDEGVYFSASALLVRGVLPYRDFVFVHPPGLLYVLGIVSWLGDPAHAFAAARVLATIVGAINIFLVGRIAAEASGTAAGIAAAALYATYPDAVSAERGPFLEPVLNLVCLAGALAWLRRKPIAAGILGGAACAVKVFGGIWILGALLSSEERRDVPRFLGGAALAGALLVGPLFIFAPHAFIEQTLLFHAWRPPDGIVSRTARLPEILGGGHVVATILAAVALLSLLLLRATRAERLFAVAGVLTALSFLASSSYWNQYNAHLAASECVLAGLGAAFLMRSLDPRAAAVVALLLAIPSAWQSLIASRGGPTELPAIGAIVRDSVPASDCVVTFEPQWSLAAGRLPVVVDSYGTMLLDAVRGGVKFPDTATAFQSPRAQPLARNRLARCHFAILGWRGNWQMNAESRAWFTSQFVCDTPSAGDLCLWERWGPSHRTSIAFGDGWYGEEGMPPHSWRWMGARSTATLPALAGGARLELAFEVPQANLPATITVALNGRVVDRYVETRTTSARAYDAEGKETQLVITTSRTISPSRLGVSADTRELGLKLDRIVWLHVEHHTK
ncbi:MAG TPA: glycosyltransferase 87 family protein [Thermoanaerobaculia bacterium]|nr:glycosyltransferase 87 family protein [Thermoanaerobaculia bacterium]